MRNYFLFILAILSLSCYSQTEFNNGYFVDNTGKKNNCLIKDIDWNTNPTAFEYKLSLDSDSKKATITNVKEFGVDDVVKYVRAKVNIDRSSEVLSKLSQERKPDYKEEELFLKVIIEGRSNLYEYIDNNLTRFFYGELGSAIEQLIFKSYSTKDNQIAQNNGFRQQLITDLKCQDFTADKIKNVDYKKNDLIRIFTEYTECTNGELIYFEKKQDRNFFNLSIRPRFNNASLTAEGDFIANQTIDFGNKTSFGIGVEAEIILPINKYKWAIAIEPTYQSYKSEAINEDVESVFGGTIISKVDYSVIAIPLSLRHYMFLNENSKLFLDVSFVYALSSNSSIDFENTLTSFTFQRELETGTNLGFGLGYKFNDTYSLEIKYQTRRELLEKDPFLSSSFNNVSLILGYTLF